jgi:hypothetical protein
MRKSVITMVAGAALAVLAVAGCGSSSPAHHAAAAARTTTPSATRAVVPSTAPAQSSAPPQGWKSCSSHGGIAAKVASDGTAQKHLAAQITSGSLALPAKTADRILAGAWTPPGTYSGALDKLRADARRENLSQAGGGLAAAVAQTVVDGQSVQLDLQSGYPVTSDWHTFTRDLAVLASDCRH